MRFAQLAETLRNRIRGERHSKEGNGLPNLRLETVYVAGNISSSMLGNTKVSGGTARDVEHQVGTRRSGSAAKYPRADIVTSRRRANGKSFACSRSRRTTARVLCDRRLVVSTETAVGRATGKSQFRGRTTASSFWINHFNLHRAIEHYDCA